MARTLLSQSSITGEVKAFAGTSAPEGYLFCHGQAVSRTDYAGLFAVLGTSHGSGDGSTTFNLPDYRGQFLRGRVNVTTVTGSGTAASNQATFTNHGINRTGFRVRLSSGTLSGLAVSTDYFAIVVDANTLAFATTQANALSNTRIAISGANSAVITQFEDPDASSRIAATVGGNSGDLVGSVQEDAVQGHHHDIIGQNLNGTGGGNLGPIGNNITGTTQNLTNNATTILTDGSNGIPRISSESRPKNSLINYIIKY